MNKKRMVQTLLAITSLLFLFGLVGCVTVHQQPAGIPTFCPKQFDATQYRSKVDNFIIVLDASSSMKEYCGNKTNPKFIEAKAVAGLMNMTIPELGQNAGLRSFGHDPAVSKNITELFYGMDVYNTTSLDGALAEITRAGGYSPLGVAMDAVGTNLESLSGTTAVVIISDGLDMNPDTTQAAALKEKYGDAICFYPIQVGEAAEGTAFLSEIASIGGCDNLINADALLNTDAMAAFVEKVFIERITSMDSDGDGVLDPDDQCPGTPAGAKVNEVGCWVLDNVLFDFNKAVIKSQTFARLDAVYEILEKNPAMSVELQGHTDSVGSKKYNMGLSLERANAVAKYLASKGIARNRIATTGFGFDKPVALNSTAFGRSLNRRVELHPY